MCWSWEQYHVDIDARRKSQENRRVTEEAKLSMAIKPSTYTSTESATGSAQLWITSQFGCLRVW